jgi:microcystin-dependent protein
MPLTKIQSNGISSTAGIAVGSIVGFTSSTVPINFLECDGSAISRTTYSTLFTIISTTYGVGNGTTTFNIPDFRGQFPRGFDNGAGVDSGRTLGSTQTDGIKTHTHDKGGLPYPPGPAAAYAAAGYNSFFDSLSGSTGNNASATSETRPKNLTLVYCIRYQ